MNHPTQDQPSTAAQYYASGYWKPLDLWTSFADCAQRNAERVALIADEKQMLFGELLDAAARLGCGLRALGVQHGDVVVIHGRNSIETTQALLACAYVGAVMAPVPPMFSVAQLASVFESAHARFVIALGDEKEVSRAHEAAGGVASVARFVASDDVAAPAAALRWSELHHRGELLPRNAVDPEALALLVYSSGTTGAPKGVMHSANTVRYAIEQRARLHGVVPGDVSLVVSQFGFVGSVVFGLLLGPLTGASSVLMRSWNGDAAVRLIERHRVSYGLMMPTHVHDLLSSSLLPNADVGSFRRSAMGGLARERRLEVRRRLCPQPLPAYGMSECLGYTSCSLDDPEDKALTTEGHPYPGTQTIVCDDDDRPVKAGVTGAILVRGPSRFLGYHGAGELSAQAITAQGWFRTGDLGWLDEAGYITFVAREKDIIRRGGVTIVPGDLEATLMGHPRIEHVAVVGLPDARLGERACACVITRDGAPIALQELTDFLDLRGVARYTWPESVAMFSSFPRSASLKVQKRALVEQLTKDQR